MIPSREGTDQTWRFVLYLAGDKPGGHRAEKLLRMLCHRHLESGYEIEVVDVTDPESEPPRDVLAVPLIVRRSPLPEARVVGDLSQLDTAAEALGLADAGLADE